MSKTSSSTVSELARLFGIREDAPDRYKLIAASGPALEHLLEMVDVTVESPSNAAHFISLYLPSLLNVFRDLPPASKLGFAVVVLLEKCKVPQVSRSLYRLDEARELPILLLRRIFAYPLSALDGLKPTTPFNPAAAMISPLVPIWPSFEIAVLMSLAMDSVRFGSASKCDFNFAPSLVKDFSKATNHHLSQPFFCDAPKLQRDKLATARWSSILKENLEMLVSIMGLEQNEKPLFSEEKRLSLLKGGKAGGTTTELFWCEASGAKMDDEEQNGLCSKCLCVAYCSVECQRKDWKKHKPVCVRPSWC